MMKKWSRILTALAVLVAALACTKVEPEATRVITLHFSTGDMQTKAVSPTAADGSAIYIDNDVPDLIILIVDNNPERGGNPNENYGKVIQRYSGADNRDGTPQSVSATETSVSFDMVQGDYVVYAFANTEALWNMTDGVNPYTYATLINIGTQASLEALEFVRPVSVAALNPVTPLDRIPLSGKANLSVSQSGNGEVQVDLLRCVAKVTAKFINNTGNNLTLEDFEASFNNLFPDCGYVIKNGDVLPGDAQDGDLTASKASWTINQSAADSLSWLVFPSIGPYTCDISFSENSNSHTYSDLPITDNRSVSIARLLRNQHLHIETRISRGITVSFNFEVSDWREKTASVTFD